MEGLHNDIDALRDIAETPDKLHRQLKANMLVAKLMDMHLELEMVREQLKTAREANKARHLSVVR